MTFPFANLRANFSFSPVSWEFNNFPFTSYRAKRGVGLKRIVSHWRETWKAKRKERKEGEISENMQKFVDRKVEEEKEILEMWGWKKGVAWREENAKDERNERNGKEGRIFWRNGRKDSRWKNREEIRNVNRKGWNQTSQHPPSACMHLYSTLSLTRKVNVHGRASCHKI